MNHIVPCRFFSTSQILPRWHKDRMANRDLYRYGYKDKVKRTGALPRLDEDAKKYDKQPIFEPDAAFAPKRALYGQNDYIDILGENPDALKPQDVHYHMPKYLRGVSGYDNDYQQAIKLKSALSQTAVPEVRPKDWDFLTSRIIRRYNELERFTNQNKWTNYKGVRGGPVKDPFSSKS